jgi:hypothetical protein
VKTAEQIISALDQMMRSISERPSMHAQGAEAVEALLFHLECLRDIAVESAEGTHGAGNRQFTFDDGTTGYSVKAHVEEHYVNRTDDERCRLIAQYWRKYLDDMDREKLSPVPQSPPPPPPTPPGSMIV